MPKVLSYLPIVRDHSCLFHRRILSVYRLSTDARRDTITYPLDKFRRVFVSIAIHLSLNIKRRYISASKSCMSRAILLLARMLRHKQISLVKELLWQLLYRLVLFCSQVLARHRTRCHLRREIVHSWEWYQISHLLSQVAIMLTSREARATRH